MEKVLLLAALFFMTGTVNGHGGSHQKLPEPGYTPGSIMYGFEKVYESVSLALTFNQESKVRKKVSFAEERLAESVHLAKNNRTRLAAQTSKRYLERIKEAERVANNTGNENLVKTVRKKKEENSKILQDLDEKLPE